MFDLDTINSDPHLFALEGYPLVTVYDDNHYVRNEYDVLVLGQRRYLINFFQRQGFVQRTGKLLAKDHYELHFPRPARSLAVSTFDPTYLQASSRRFFCVTPTGFAEAMFYDSERIGLEVAVDNITRLIEVCPYNIEWLRDISYASPIEAVTRQTYRALSQYQAEVVARKFARKRRL